MLIAITSDGLDPGSFVAEKFGRTPFIIFYDTDKNTLESLRNPYINSFGGAGVQTAQFIIGKNAEAVITIDIGLGPLRLLNSAEIEVYACPKISIKEAANEFVEKKLSIIKQESFQNFASKGRERKRRDWNKNI